MSAKAKDETFWMTWQNEFADRRLCDSAGCARYVQAITDWRRAGRPNNIKEWISNFLGVSE